MNQKITVMGFLLLLSLFSSIQPTHALFDSKDITFSVDQKDYYFKTGENAMIPLKIENTYGKTIDGMLTYTYTQEVNQGGMHMSSSNSQSTSLSVEGGETTPGLSFGTSNSPSDLSINLKFTYNDGKDSRVVNLDGISVHFVSDEDQKKNEQNEQSSSSEKQSQQSQSQQTQTQQQQSQQQQQQQALQNNQMAQDSSALKKQMQQQLQEQQQKEKALQQQKQEMLDKLQQNEQFQEYKKQLEDQGYTQQDMELSKQGNTTNLKMNYQNPTNNNTAEIKAEVMNQTIQNIEMQENKDKKNHHLGLFFFIMITVIIGYFAYRKWYVKPEPEQVIIEEKPKPFNYRKESLKMLKTSKKLFDQKKHKDAYGLAGSALRLFLSHHNKLNKEVTNDVIIAHLRKNNKKHKEAKECFDLCSLVEFAKYGPNKNDFEKIIKQSMMIIDDTE